MPPVLQFLTNLQPAPAAPLAGTARIHLDEQATGTLSLVRQLGEEAGPSGVVNGLGKHTARQPLDVEILNRDQAEAPHQRMGQLVLKVQPLVAYMSMGDLKYPNSLFAPLAALFPPRDLSLSAAKGRLSMAVLTGVSYHGAVR